MQKLKRKFLGQKVDFITKIGDTTEILGRKVDRRYRDQSRSWAPSLSSHVHGLLQKFSPRLASASVHKISRCILPLLCLSSSFSSFHDHRQKCQTRPPFSGFTQLCTSVSMFDNYPLLCCSSVIGSIEQRLLKEIGLSFLIHARADSSTARAVTTEQGANRKMKHIHTRSLFIQDLVVRKILTMSSVKTDVNPSDIGTKALGRERFHRLRSMLGMGTELSETSSPGKWYTGDE